MFKKFVLFLFLFIVMKQTSFALYDLPCYSGDDPINQTGINYSSYIPSEARRVNVRGIEYYHSNIGPQISSEEWSTLQTNLRNIFLPYKIYLEFSDIESQTGPTVNSYINNLPSEGGVDCSDNFIQWLSGCINSSNDKKSIRILFVPTVFQNRDTTYYGAEWGSIFGEFDSRVLFYSFYSGDPNDNVHDLAYRICASLGLYDVQANISGNGDYVDDTGTYPYPTDNLMYFPSISTIITTGQKGRLHWALKNHDNLKPLIRESALFKNLVNNQNEGYLYLDHNSSDLIASGNVRDLLDRDAHNITTLERQIPKGSTLHQLSHWKDMYLEMRSGKFRQSEDFNFDKKNPSWIAEFKSTGRLSFTSNIGTNSELNDPWYNENLYFVPASNYPVLLNENVSLLPTEPIYKLHATNYNRVFDYWSSSQATIISPTNRTTQIVFNQSDVTVTANYVPYLPSTITSSTTISGKKDCNGTVTVSGSSTVVTIAAGAEIYNGNMNVTNGAKIVANGTSGNPIRFINMDHVELHTNNNSFNYCIFEGGYVKSKGLENQFNSCIIRMCDEDIPGAFIAERCDNGSWSKFRLNNCTIEENEEEWNAGIYVDGAYGSIQNCTIRNNIGSGIALKDARIGESSSALPNSYFINNNIYNNNEGEAPNPLIPGGYYIGYGISLCQNAVVYFGRGTQKGLNRFVNNVQYVSYQDTRAEVALESWSSRLYAGNGTSDGGYNDIYHTYSATSFKYIYSVAKTSSGGEVWTVKAENNFWGSSSPNYVYFSQGVDYQPWQNSSQTENPGASFYIPYSPPELMVTKVVPVVSIIGNSVLAKQVLSSGIIKAITNGDSNDNPQELIDIKQSMLDMRNSIKSEPNSWRNAQRLLHLHHLSLDFDPADNLQEKCEIVSLMTEKKDNLQKLKQKGKKAISALPDSIYQRMVLLGEVAMYIEVDMLLQSGNYREALAKIKQYDKYFENTDSRRELYICKLEALKNLGEYQQALEVLGEVREEAQADENSLPGYTPPSYCMIERELFNLMGLDSIFVAKRNIGKETYYDLNPTKFSLGSNYPNPFNPTTTIPFDLPEVSRVKIQVYDLAGREVAVPANGFYPAGSHQVTFDGNGLPSGMYFIRAQLKPEDQRKDAHHFTGKMMLLK